MQLQKLLKYALPALLMSALMFMIMPGSVRYYGPQVPEQPLHFFNLQLDHPAANCLPLAGVVAFVAAVLAVVAAFSRQRKPYRAVSWCALAAAALTAAPYVLAQEGTLLQPNVIVTVILTACWLIAIRMDKQKDQQKEDIYKGNRL